MDMVKVDPQLFVTCRLCLENMGMYQITPVVQQQVKYCFDIEIDPFDGLPQLICKSCETILSEYHTKKRIFIGRQNALKAKLAVRKEVEEESRKSPQQEAVSSSQQNHNENSEISSDRHTRPRKRIARILSTSSSSDAERNKSPSVAVNTKKQSKRKKRTAEPWETDYNKMFSCNLCEKSNLKSKDSLRKHMKRHSDLISQYHNIINRPCILSVTKIDGKINKTGSSNAVVIGPDKIIGPERNNTYTMVYCAKENDRLNHIPKDQDDDSPIRGKPTKKRRLLSGSSTDTVVLDGNHSRVTPNSKDDNNVQFTVNKEEPELECINIDDSSNSSNDSAKSDTNVIKLQETDKRAIDNIIKVSHSKYILRKHETSDSDSKPKDLPLIKHKILSMGRKVIHKEGLACTGLLRFIERQNLEIKWIPTNSSKKTATTDGKFVRIMPRLKGREDISPERSGWKYVTHPPEKIERSRTSINQTKSNETHHVYAVAKDKMSIKVHNKNQKPQPEITLNESESDRKLLNANPVANPKQLPKKLNIPENKILLKTVAVAVSVPNAVVLPNTVVVKSSTPSQSLCILSPNPDKETCMPIITSTTSLAVPSLPVPPLEQNGDNKVNGDETCNTVNAVEVEKPAPRIKVKPFAELMSERALQMISGNQGTATSEPSGGVRLQDTPSGFWKPGCKIAPNPNQMATITEVSTGIPVPNTAASTGVPLTIKSVKSGPALHPLHALSRGSVTLDTVEFPNTTTDSPFNYVRNLLQIHNILLLNSDQPVPQNFTCLIKFKLMFLRETVDTPVTLSLSVHCFGNNFSIVVKDSQQLTVLDLNKLSATWQWEILKTFVTRADIIQKMTQNAQKLGPEAHANTQGFLCVLKSIKYTAVSQIS